MEVRNEEQTTTPSRRAANTINALSVEMPPPQFRPLRPQLVSDEQHSPTSSNTEAHSEAETTPRLHPLSSPGLPLVSPLVKVSGAGVDYFLEPEDRMSELDESGETLPVSDRPRLGSLQTTAKPDVVSLITPEDEVFPQSRLTHEQPQTQEYELRSQEDLLEDDEVQVLGPSMGEADSAHSQIPGLPDVLSGFRERASQQQLEALSEVEDMYGPLRPNSDIDTNELNEVLDQGQILTTETNFGNSEVTRTHPHLGFRGWEQDTASQSVHRQETDHLATLDSLIAQAAPVFRPHSSSTSRSLDGAVEDVTQLRPSTAEASLRTHTDVEDRNELPHTILSGIRNEEDGAMLSPTDMNMEPRVSEDHINAAKESETAVHALSDYLPTPEATQQELPISFVDVPSNALESQMLPTPQKTQEPPSSLPEEVANNARIEQTSIEAVTLQQYTPNTVVQQTLRRSQRHRSSLVSEFISHSASPYFTPIPLRSMLSSSPPLSPSQKENIPPPRSPRKSPFDKDSLPTLLEERNGVVKEKSRNLSTAARSYGLSTPSSYYPPLATIDEFYATNVDVLAVCSTLPPKPLRAKTGPKDFHSTLQLTDPSLPSNDIVLAQIFRAYETAVPTLNRGDVILLRNMKVQSLKGKFTLLSTDTSSWAVFAHPDSPYTKGTLLATTVAGPPVEYGPDERSGAIDLMQWWDKDGHVAHPAAREKTEVSPENDVTIGATESADAAEVNGTETPTVRRSRRKANYTDNIGDAAELANTSIRNEPRRRPGTSPMSQRPSTAGSTKSRRFESVIHELRDGTKYVDDEHDDGRRRARRSGSLIHELRDGRSYIDE